MISLATQANLANAKPHSDQEGKISKALGEHENSGSDGHFPALTAQRQTEHGEMPALLASLAKEQPTTNAQSDAAAVEGEEVERQAAIDNLVATQAALPSEPSAEVQTQPLAPVTFSLAKQRLADSQEHNLNVSATFSSSANKNLASANVNAASQIAATSVAADTGVQSIKQASADLISQVSAKLIDAAPNSQLAAPQITAQATPNTAAHQPATAQGVEWAPVRVDTQAGKWGEQMMQVLHDRVTLQAQQNMQEARIRLDPPDLGKLDLTVRVEGDRLNVQINTSTAATREALMQVSERLRVELQQQNFVHVDVNVGSDQHQQQQPQPSFEEESTIFASREFSSSDSATTTNYSEHWLNTQA